MAKTKGKYENGRNPCSLCYHGCWDVAVVFYSHYFFSMTALCDVTMCLCWP